MRSSPIVLVTDGEHRAALAIIRSLGRAGYHVIVASPRRRNIGGASRWARAGLLIPDPLKDPASFISALRAAIARYSVDVLLPVTDQSLLPVLSAAPAFERVTIPFPDLQTWRRVADKSEVLAVAETIGIRVPRQLKLSGPPSEVLKDLDYPVVVKPARSLVVHQNGRLKLAVRHVRSREELDRTLASLPEAAWPVLVQRRLSGPGIGVFLLVRNGVPLAQFAHRRILEKPPWGGVSVCSESVAAPRDLLDQSLALLRSLGWSGVAMVEYKLDRPNGDPYLMEVNGRFWGSLQLAIDAGVDFPRLLVDAATGQEVTPVLTWRCGVRLRWRLGEVDHFLARLRRLSSRPALAAGIPSLAAAFRHAIIPAWRPGTRGEVFRLDDPWPGLVELGEWVRGR